VKILVAEDSIVSRHLLEAMLRKWGYQPIVAADGIAALQVLQADHEIHLAILDWMMPGLTGPEICRLLRKEASRPYVYAIMLTSKSLKEDLIEGLESGADDYLTKPFDQHELKVRIRAGQRLLQQIDKSHEALPDVHFYSCFISYSSKDQEFVSKLYTTI